MDDMGLERPTFQENEMADLIAFLYFLRFLEKEPNVERGEMLFGQKGCRSCHHFGDADVEGSFSLSTLKTAQPKVDVAASMWNHANEMSQKMTRKKMEWPRLLPGEMNDLIEYILSHNNDK